MDRIRPTIPLISAEESARRKAAIDYARASVRREGFILDEHTEALFARYTAGEITRAELTAQGLRRAGVDI